MSPIVASGNGKQSPTLLFFFEIIANALDNYTLFEMMSQSFRHIKFWIAFALILGIVRRHGFQKGDRIEEFTGNESAIGYEVAARSHTFNLTIASRLTTDGGLVSSIAFCNSARIEGNILGSIIFANCDIDLGHGCIADSLVICAGNVSSASTENNVIVALGRIKVAYDSEWRKSILISEYKDAFKNHIRFDAESLGFTLRRAAQKSVAVDLARTIKKRTGFLQDDILLAISGKEIDSPEDAARNIRRWAVSGALTTVATVKRKDRIVYLTIWPD